MGKWLFTGKEWDRCDDDYLMGADVDYQNPQVIEEINAWGSWIIKEVGFDGFRIDAAKHIDYDFTRQGIDSVQSSSSRELFLWLKHGLITLMS